MSIRWFMGGKPHIEPYLRELEFVSNGSHEFIVPYGVREIKALVIGGGASYSKLLGGKGGGVISGIIPVKSGQTLTITVGGISTVGGTSSIVRAGDTLLQGNGGTSVNRGGTAYNQSVQILSNYSVKDLPTTIGKACISWLQMCNDAWEIYDFNAAGGASIGESTTSPGKKGTISSTGYGIGGKGASGLASGSGGAGVIGGAGGNHYSTGGEGGTGLGGGGGGGTGYSSHRTGGSGAGGSWNLVDGVPVPQVGYDGEYQYVSGGSMYTISGRGGSGFLMTRNGGYGSSGTYGAPGGGGGGGKFGGYGGNAGTPRESYFINGADGGSGGFGGNGGNGSARGNPNDNVDGVGGNGGPGAVVIWY